MRKYWEMLKSQIKIDTQYVAWYWAQMFTQILQLVIIFSFWNAVYENRSTISDMPLENMLTYVIIAYFLGFYTTGVGTQLANNVRDGSVSIELMRPYDLLNKLVALDLGFKVSASIRGTLPMILIATFFMGLQGPVSWEAGVMFAISALVGILIGSQLDLILGVLAFYLHYIWGLRVLRNAILLFFTGQLIPINLFPDWLQTVSYFLPFQSMIYVPVAIFTGQLTGLEAAQAMMMQLMWLGIIIVVIRALWYRALKRVTIFGG